MGGREKLSVGEPRSYFATRHVHSGIKDESYERSCGRISSFSFLIHEQTLAGNLLCGIVLSEILWENGGKGDGAFTLVVNELVD